MGSVESGTYVLPPYTHQNIAFKVDQSHGYLIKLVEIIHKGLDSLNINNISKIQIIRLPGR
jgi:hypothetical protein